MLTFTGTTIMLKQMKYRATFSKTLYLWILCGMMAASVHAQNPPGDLTASTFLGGNASELFVLSTDQSGFMLHPNGDIYICGPTKSTNFPSTPGVFQRSFAGGTTDAFIARMSADLSNLVACTFLGGTGEDVITDIKFNTSGDIIVCGYTTSYDFPVTPNAYDTTINDLYGQGDAFISILDENLTDLHSSTFLGGTSSEKFHHMRMDTDSQDNIIISGGTFSYDFPVTAGSLFNNPIEPNDLFISKLDANLEFLLASTYFGANSWDQVLDLVVDTADNIYLCGATAGSNFPVSSLAYDQIFNGEMDAYICILGNNLDTLIASTYLGGEAVDLAVSMDFDNKGNLIVGGSTGSMDFPVIAGAWDTTFNLVSDCYVGIFSNRLDSLLHCSFFGGDNWDECFDVLYDSSLNAIFFTGLAGNGKFPVLNTAFDPEFNGETDCFITRVSTDLGVIEASTFLGGLMNEFGLELELSNDDQLLIAGNVSSENFPVTMDAYDTTINGVYDIFIAKFVKNLSGSPVGFNDVVATKNDYSIQAAPNPFHDYLEIYVTQAATDRGNSVKITLYNNSGKKVLEREEHRLTNGSHKINIQTGQLRAGVYVCRIDLIEDNKVIHQNTMKVIKR